MPAFIAGIIKHIRFKLFYIVFQVQIIWNLCPLTLAPLNKSEPAGVLPALIHMNISKLPVCTTEQGVKIIKSSIKKLNDWCDISELIPSRFKKNNKLKKTGLCGLFSASLELTREGLISIMQKKNFERLLIKENNNEKRWCKNFKIS